MRNIILLSDGTGNSAAKRHKTNVWRLYRALDLDDPDKQIAFYNDGVGSQEFLAFKLLGGAFGWGLKRNVIELYMTLCRTYKKGDNIYLFGFSRGAFTVRMLAGLIAHCGLPEAVDGGDLRRTALRHFAAYRSKYKRGWAHRLVRGLRRLCSRETDRREPIDRGSGLPGIKFIGAWDTVDAYGFPVYELTWLWDLVILPLRFVDQGLPTNVERARHALSIDDERVSFSPLLWDETVSDEDQKEEEADCVECADDASDGNKRSTRIEQVWFPGVHADVGGGYPRNALALVTLDWMMSKVEACAKNGHGLCFISSIREEYRQRANCHGVQHDSRSGLQSYYRYKPREIERLCSRNTNAVPKIHFTALQRIQKNIVPYAPTALPSAYDVVDSPEGKESDYKKYDDEKMAAALGFVRRRRELYLAFVLVTVILGGLPLFLAGLSSSTECDGWTCLVALPFNLATYVLPDFTVPWIEGWIVLVQNPWGAAGVAITALALRQLKARWFAATQKHAMEAWRELKDGAEPDVADE